MRSKNDITGSIVGSAIRVHQALGPGLLESTYEACLMHELMESGISVRNQVVLPVRYKGVVIDTGYRVDLLVEERVIVELKSVEKILPVHKAQLLSYLRLSNNMTGLLINFNECVLKNGIRRVVNGYPKKQA